MLAHRPYDGSSKPFTIGVRPLEPARWIEPNDKLESYLAQKQELFADKYADVFAARENTADSQREIRDALADYLTGHHPHLYRRDGVRIRIAQGPRTVTFDDETPALLQAANLVQDDLAIMRKDGTVWRLVAAAICFPSTWVLREKFNRTLAEIHAPVPGFAGEMERRVTRIFDNLRVGAPVERFNWSIYDNDRLHHPLPSPTTSDAGFIRVERQTLMKMPHSRDILFTIRVLIDPIAAFHSNPDGSRLAASMRGQLLAMTDAQLAYKGMSENRDRLAAELAKLAALN
ncbi:DUF3445 domain-containing protein [Roseiarcaceae bacterium H3SJ34-1]|uniref:heme-dependent oxidative N-demethylase family protein n=1 Tax=Terripilifer ovatus TaxID=3032367 RepID=UPI003AB95E9D|nr:DUF3445 domain-containing protein [Roseiarcaceae bacterium H3SJ34-1]